MIPERRWKLWSLGALALLPGAIYSLGRLTFHLSNPISHCIGAGTPASNVTPRKHYASSLREAKTGTPVRNLEAGAETETIEEYSSNGLILSLSSATLLRQPWPTGLGMMLPTAS